MKWQTMKQQAGCWLQTGLKTTPNRIVLLGLVVVLAYLVFWFGVLLLRSVHGSASGMLQLVAIGLGVYQLWKQRRTLATQTAPEEDQLLGQILTVSGALFFPICLVATWSEPMVSAMIMALVCVIILAGMACSLWGVRFFSTYPVSIFLLCLGLLPKPAEITRAIWQSFTAPEILERSMAWVGTAALQAIGQPAVAHGIYISLPSGAVQIGWGCNGFDMAVTMIVASFVLGLFLKQNRWKIVLLMAVGAVLALVFNIPRIMLVTIAAVYWGNYWFNFWHDSWGSQIFVSVLFTIYYYVVMAIVKARSRKSHN